MKFICLDKKILLVHKKKKLINETIIKQLQICRCCYVIYLDDHLIFFFCIFHNKNRNWYLRTRIKETGEESW